MNDEQIKALSGHTPGPWKQSTTPPISYIGGDYEHSPIVAQVFGSQGTDRMMNDAALIAAAPDLLAEVERLRSQADFLSYELVNAPQYKAQRDKLVEALRTIHEGCRMLEDCEEISRLDATELGDIAFLALEEVTK